MQYLLERRRSIRRYRNTPIDKDKAAKLVKAALLAPSSRNLKSWEFVVVDEREVLEKLSRAKEHGGSFLKDAPLGIVVLGDSEISDAWIEDTSIACTLIQLTAEAMGLGSCWIQIRNRMHGDGKTAEEYIQQILNLPERMKVEAIIAIGYTDECKTPHSENELRYDKVYINKYGVPYEE